MANAQVEYKYVPTSRGGRYLCVGNFMYRISKRGANDVDYWKCSTKNCPGKITTRQDIPLRGDSTHNHQPVRKDIQLHETLDSLKTKAKTSLAPMQGLYEEEIRALRDGPWTDANRTLVEAIPTFHTMKDALYRACRSTFPPLPTHRRDLIVPEQYRTTDAGDQFLIIDDGDDNKILGFSSARNLEHLCAVDTIFGDGTFYVVPAIFCQLYTLHAVVADRTMPLVYLLLPDKKQTTYDRAFRLVKEAAEARGLRFQPDCVQMDFEVAARNAVKAVFPGVQWKGCFFHFTQCVWRKTQQVGLQIDYSENPDVNHFVRLCAVLPLVPVADVEEVWLQTLAEMPDDDRCLQLADYITSNWIEGSLPIGSWNHYLTTGPRTNNNLEGWHGRLKKLVGKAHPNIFELIRFLLTEQKTTEIKTVQYAAGQRLPPKKKKYEDLQRKLSDLKSRLDSGHIAVSDYAARASHLLKLA